MSDAFLKALLLGVPLAFVVGRLLPAKFRTWRVPLAIIGGWGLAALMVAMLSTGRLAYLTSFGILAGIYSVLSLGLNIQWGFTGLFNIGIAAFFSVGAFTTALFTTTPAEGAAAAFTEQAFGLGAPFLVGVLAAGAISGLVALLIGVPTLKLREDYLAISSIGIAEVVRLIFQNERWLANGPQPLRGIPRPLFCLADSRAACPWVPEAVVTFFEPLSSYSFVYLVIVTLFLVVIYVLIEQLIRSPWGRVLRAIREEESSTAMSGKHVSAFKMQAFVLGAVVMGMGGALYAHHMVAIDYSHFDPLYATFLIWVMLMLGGSANNLGAILGAFVVYGIWQGTPELVRYLPLAQIHPSLAGSGPYIRFLIIALMLILILIYRPKGIFGEQKFLATVTKR